MDALFEPIAEATGGSIDQIKLIACLLFSYPLGSVYIRIPSSHPELKHIFSILVTFFYLIPVLGLWGGAIQLLVSVLATYYMAQRIERPSMPWLVFIFTMGHLTINHIIRTYIEAGYDTMEISGPQMVLTMKLTTFAWNIWDGRRPSEDLDKWQTEQRVVEYPSLLEFLGYAFYFPGFLVGPYLTYNEYQALVTGSLYKAAEQREWSAVNETSHLTKRLVPHGRKRVAFKKMFIGLIFLALYVLFYPELNYGITIEDEFESRRLLSRIILLQFCGFFERTKYYAVWTLTEGASIQTGLGFTGYTESGSTKWEGAANVNVMNIEFAENTKVLLDSWNMKTNIWLRECVYKRVTPKGKKPGFRSSLATFATSAFWHGIAPGYYLSFFFYAFVQTTGRLARSYLRPLVLPANYVAQRGAPPPPQTRKKQLYDVLGVITTVMLTNYGTLPFMLLNIDDSFVAWNNVVWYGHFVVAGALVFFYMGGSTLLTQVQAVRVKQAGYQMERDEINRSVRSLPGTPVKALTLPPVDEAARALEKELAKELAGGQGK
ncbi:MBOAT-domain-containing protein [Dichomitus squalens]|uniref:MBOAT-domain-containing protein n=1 Tax=Dichomitus squalens TaxID=114155 RepID=A0A4V2K348_9APHY|nr:MBOAT-domain-containing protein [Dichomitus squalens LYAD-421 SS1]EJF62867.1 MBOAT-domain-containing protein [Dichomitus squalens LYAD-421 SS1]TBU32001.1 MBOAT-domain-containing protein [Dichomitus squalens]TBU39153.1 MBOAT-domain-containing protein [Dichomitus squalens]TBU64171.1 MBOAT-domain-containing protein [Dichomitus squalens]